MQHPTILALDISSTTIGWCLHSGTVAAHGTIALNHRDVNHRCRLARAHVHGLLLEHGALDCAAIEEPASRFKGALIPQCFVSGAVRALLAEREIAICDVAPAAAKKALALRGDADKLAMLVAAAPRFGYAPTLLAYREVKKSYAAFLVDGSRVFDEHAADALGVALASVGRVVEVAA